MEERDVKGSDVDASATLSEDERQGTTTCDHVNRNAEGINTPVVQLTLVGKCGDNRRFKHSVRLEMIGRTTKGDQCFGFNENEQNNNWDCLSKLADETLPRDASIYETTSTHFTLVSLFLSFFLFGIMTTLYNIIY